MNWSLHADRYDEIRSTVADVIEDWGISEYPFDMQSLLRKMRVSIIPYSALPDTLKENLIASYPDAFTIYPPDFDPRKTIIYYNDEIRDSDRIRFTLAHELGHLILMHPDSDDEIYEHEANIFANYLLAPAPLILEFSSIDYAIVSADFAISHGCAMSACDRASKRRQYGPSRQTEYERRILAACTLKRGGDQIAPVRK